MEAAYAKHSANIRQFHMAQAHAYSLSPNNVHRGYREWPGAKATYTNINGQEYIDVELTTNKGNQQQSESKDHWDWALIEIVIPDIGQADITYADIKAKRRVPAPQELAEKFDGYAFDQGESFGGVTYWSDGMSPYVISFPPRTDTPIESVLESDGINQIASLQVDLIPITGSTVIIDLYGYLNQTGATQEITIGYMMHSASITETTIQTRILNSSWEHASYGRLLGYVVPGYSTPQFTSSGLTPANAYIPPTPPPLNPPGTGLVNVSVPAPDMVVAESGSGTSLGVYEYDPIYDLRSHLLLQETFDYLRLVDTSNPPNYLYDVIRQVQRHTVTPITKSVPIPTYGSRLTDIRGIAGFGQPKWVVSQHLAPDAQWWQWEVSTFYPERLGTAVLGYKEISTPDPDATDPYQHLGFVSIDPVLKSISFTPA